MTGHTDIRQIPDTPAGRRLTALLALLSDDCPQDALRRFLDEHAAPGLRDAVPFGAHARTLAQWRAGSGGLEFYAVRTYEPARPENESVAILRGRRDGQWRGLLVQVEPAPPHAVARMQMAPARPPAGAPAPPRLERSEALERLDACVDELVAADAFSGAALIAIDGEPVYERAAGEACKSFGVPNRVDTKFNLGSMNKMFTAVAAARLVEAGELSYDEPIGRWLGDEWIAADVGRRVTLGRLLAHTSGLGDYFGDEFQRASRERFRTLRDYQPLVREQTLQFEPGARWRYSNVGYLLAGAILEAVTGQDYDACVCRQVYEPADMRETGLYDLDRPIPGAAIGYSPAEPGPGGEPPWRTNLFKHVIRGGPAGGGFSTVGDLLKFDRALRGGALLAPEAAGRLWTPKPGSPAYGYGFRLHGEPGSRVVGHTGRFAGISNTFEMHLDRGLTIIVLCNYDHAAPPVAQQAAWLLGSAVV